MRICTGLIKSILSTCNPGNRLTTDFSESLPRSLISWALRVSSHVRILHIKLLSSLSVGHAYESTDFTQTHLAFNIHNNGQVPSCFSQIFKTHRNIVCHYFIKQRHLSLALNAIYSYGVLFP